MTTQATAAGLSITPHCTDVLQPQVEHLEGWPLFTGAPLFLRLYIYTFKKKRHIQLIPAFLTQTVDSLSFPRTGRPFLCPAVHRKLKVSLFMSAQKADRSQRSGCFQPGCISRRLLPPRWQESRTEAFTVTVTGPQTDHRVGTARLQEVATLEDSDTQSHR